MKFYEFEYNINNCCILPSGVLLVNVWTPHTIFPIVIGKEIHEFKNLWLCWGNLKYQERDSGDIFGIGLDGLPTKSLVFLKNEDFISHPDFLVIDIRTKEFESSEYIFVRLMSGIKENGVIILHKSTKRWETLEFDHPYHDFTVSPDGMTVAGICKKRLIIFDNPLME